VEVQPTLDIAAEQEQLSAPRAKGAQLTGLYRGA
jgi:hypothetical protein